jgi:hypothetical protein
MNETQTQIPLTKGKKILNHYAKITIFAGVAGMLLILSAFVYQSFAPSAHAEIETLTKEKMTVEIELKNALQRVKDAQHEVDNATSIANDLRGKRATLETSINSKINPDAVK